MGQRQKQPEDRTPQPRTRIGPSTSGSAGESGGPPAPPGDYDPGPELKQVEDDARRRARKTWILLPFLTAIAVGALGAGVVADNAIFWGAATTVFFMSSAALITYLAVSLGVFAQTIEMIRARSDEGRGKIIRW